MAEDKTKSTCCSSGVCIWGIVVILLPYLLVLCCCHIRSMCSILVVLPILIALEIYFCCLLYHVVYRESIPFSKYEAHKGKSEDSKNDKGTSDDFSEKLIAKSSKAFTYPVGISMIILAVGIVAITIIYVMLAS